MLYFNSAAALYENDKTASKKGEDVDQEQGNVRIRIKMDVPDDKVYTDLKDKKLVEQRDFMSKQFLVTSDLEPKQWKLTGREKQVAGYSCQEATLYTDKDTIVAWFTPKIPVSAGPARLYGLPGLILEASINKQFYLEATHVDLAAIDNAVLVKPRSGKKVTREEYEKIMEQKRKEMQEQFGGDGNVIIKVRR